MNYIVCVVLFFIVYTVRFYYDVNYLYSDCMKTKYTEIVLVSIVHSFILALLTSFLVLDDDVFQYAIIIAIITIIIPRLFFSDCPLTLLVNNICGEEIDYMPWFFWKIFFWLSVMLYVIRTIILILKCVNKKKD
jgi:hypothetical protein